MWHEPRSDANLSQLLRMGAECQQQPGGTHPGPEPKPPPAGPRPLGGEAADCGEGVEPRPLCRPPGYAGGRSSGTPGRWNLRAGEPGLGHWLSQAEGGHFLEGDSQR